ncbi:hypothetical protein GLAREA_04480 [Glarea lozoyensis ATCC 20868]|uniref:Uncharacterized protein n=1 Tax=Glarea lozoyensis (strain ATCC 20868 / MF5171) TaxID=1116229 RepID=S3CRG2_GLAL2|nr:uncharacterized protein GLAREA_04480 [Glarea lozoyensis ATCC 20868]EPE27689.1 hypothetical protein GLAREA_04480 [Glarea lozoyensis ATCC 20868]
MNSSRNANRSGRGRGDRGPRRGGFSDRDRNLKDVPNIQQVFPGASVSIVLKPDQPTGREVQGTVVEVLTSGNHPRGIKVRLGDGRVGRVQRIVSEETAKAGAEGLSGLGRNGESSGESRIATTMPSGFTHRKYGDYRIDVPDEPPSNELSLSDYVVVKTAKKGKGKKKSTEETDAVINDGDSTTLSAPALVTSKCPVCGDFEGDEAAVAHHVNEHFD